jgi:hypothetical protein
MPAAKHRIVIEQGATFSMELTLKDADGAVIDLTGCAGRGQLRATPTATAKLADFDVTFPTPATGQVLVEMAANVTKDISVEATNADREPTLCAYDIEIVYPSGRVDRIMEGVAAISPEVTR